MSTTDDNGEHISPATDEAPRDPVLQMLGDSLSRSIMAAERTSERVDVMGDRLVGAMSDLGKEGHRASRRQTNKQLIAVLVIVLGYLALQGVSSKVALPGGTVIEMGAELTSEAVDIDSPESGPVIADVPDALPVSITAE